MTIFTKFSKLRGIFENKNSKMTDQQIMASWIPASFLKIFSKSLTADFFDNFCHLKNYYIYVRYTL